MKLKSQAKAHQHQLFFKILGQLYIHEHQLINQYKDCYDQACIQLMSEPGLLGSRATQIIDTAISKTQRGLSEIEGAALRGRSRDMEALDGARLQHETNRGIAQRLDYLVDDTRSRLDDKAFKAIVNWLSTCRHWDHHSSVSDKVMPGSGTWITSHSKYRGWLHSASSSTLFVHGVRGCGKSSILSVAIKKLLGERQKDPTRLSVAYFYCSGARSEADRVNPDAILRSILSQVAVDQQTKTIDPTIVSDCLQLLHQITSKKTTIIVLDAVDELQSQDRSKLIQAVKSLTQGSDGLVKVLISSRNDTQIKELLCSAAMIEVSPELNRSDIESFVDMQLTSIVRDRSLLIGKASRTLLERIRTALISGAQEMFLWIELQVQVLIKKLTEKDIITALGYGLVDSLSQIYDETYESFVASDDTAKAVIEGLFCWVLYAESPLTPKALESALHLHPDLADVSLPDLSHVSSNLVVVDSATKTMRFCHPSARDYMRDRMMFSEANGHRLIATACLQKCLGPWPSFPGLSGLEKIQHIDFYAGLYWPQHLKASESGDEMPLWLVEILSRFIVDEDEQLALDFDWWLDWLDSSLQTLPPYHSLRMTHECLFSTEGPSPIFTASVFGLGVIVDLMIKRDSHLDLEQRSRTHHTPLYLACHFGHNDMASQLIQHGADVNVTCGSRGNPLQVACFRGYLDIVKTLLSYGASPKPGTPPFKNALHAACEGDQAHVVEYLIRTPSIIQTGSDYDDALQTTAEAGFFNAVEYLIRPGVASRFGWKNANKERGKLLALNSIKNGRDDQLQFYLKAGQVSKEDIPPDAMAVAALRGHSDMINSLQTLGIDIESEGKFGSPLRSASLQGHIRVVELLLELGSDPAAKLSKGDSLQAAASKGHIPIVRLLIERQVDVNQQGPPRGSPIQAAAYYGHLKVVKLLIEADADIYCETYKFKDTLHAAVEGGHHEVAAFLQENHPPPTGISLPAISRGDHHDRFWYSEQETLDPAIELRTGTDSPHPENSDEEEEIQEANLKEQSQPSLVVNKTIQSPLVLASKIGNIPRIRQELQAPYVREENIAEAFVVAVAEGTHQAIEVLLEYGLRHCIYPRNPQEKGLVAAVRHRQPALFQRLAESLNGTITIISWCCALKEAIIAGLDATAQVLDIDCIAWEPDGLDDLAFLLGYNERDPVFTDPVPACRDILQDAYSTGRHEVASLIWDWVLQRGPGTLQATCEEWQGLTLVAARYTDVSVLDRCLALNDECLDSTDSPRLSHQDLLISAIQGNNRATSDHLRDLIQHESRAAEEIAPAFLEACRQGFSDGALEWCTHDGDGAFDNDTITQGIIAASAAAHEDLVLSLINTLQDEHSICDATESALLSAGANGKMNVISRMLQDTNVRSHDEFGTIWNRVLVTACEAGYMNVVRMCLEEGASAEATVERAPSDVAPHLNEDYSGFIHQSFVPSSAWKPTVGRLLHPRPPQPSFTGSHAEYQGGYADSDYSDDSGESGDSEYTDLPDDESMTDALQASVRAFGRILNAESMPRFESLSMEWRPRAKKQLQIVSLILDHGSNLDERDSRSPNHPLRIAVQYGTDELVERLLYDAAAEQFDPEQLQDLMLTAASRRVPMSVRIIQLLLDCAHQASLPTDENGSVDPAIFGAMTIAVDSLCTPARQSDIQSKQGIISSEKSAKDLMKEGLQKLISIMFRKMSNQSARQDAIGDVLHVAAAAGDLATVRLLIKHHVDVNHTRQFFHTALGAATEFGQVQVINALLRAKAKIHPTSRIRQCFGNQEPAIKAIMGGQVQALKALIDHGLDPNVDAGDVSLLVLAAQRKSAIMMKLLLQGKADPRANPLALVTAAHNGDLEMMGHLLGAGAHPNALAFYGSVLSEEHLCSPLYMACEKGQTEAVLMLLERGAVADADSGDRDGLPLVVAARHGHLSIVKDLLDKRCNPMQRSKGLKALSSSDRNNFLRALTERNSELGQGPIVSRGGFVEPATDASGHSNKEDNVFLHAFESACDVQHGVRTSLRIVEALSSAIDDPQAQRDAFLEALRHAAKKQNTRLFEELLRLVTLDSVILDLACRCGSLTGVKMIVEGGVDATSPNQDGKMPLDVAVEYEHMEVIDFLVAHCIQPESKQDKLASLDVYYLVASILEAYAWSSLSVQKSITACEQTVESLLRTAKNSARATAANQKDLDRSLTLASHVGSVKIAVALLHLGANLGTLTDLTQLLLEWISDHGFNKAIYTLLEEGLAACFGKKSPVLLQTFLEHAGLVEICDHHLVLAIQQEKWKRGPMESDIEIILQRRLDLKPSEVVLFTLAKTRTEGNLFVDGQLLNLWRLLISRSDCGLTRKIVQAVSDRHSWQGLYDYYCEQEAAHGLSPYHDCGLERDFKAAMERILSEGAFHTL
ncbi:hypothetical protein ACHAPA_008796 [Fusarium lateritium]